MNAAALASPVNAGCGIKKIVGFCGNKLYANLCKFLQKKDYFCSC